MIEAYNLSRMLKRVKDSGLECKTNYCFYEMSGRKNRCGSNHVCPYCSAQNMEQTKQRFQSVLEDTRSRPSIWIADEWCEIPDMKEAIRSLKAQVRRSKSTDAYKALQPTATWSLFSITFTPSYRVRLASILAVVKAQSNPDKMGCLEKSQRASELFDAVAHIAPTREYRDDRYFKSFWDLLHEGCSSDMIRTYYHVTLGTKPSTLIIR